MTRLRFSDFAAALVAPVFCTTPPAAAQTVFVQQPTPDADALAVEMRLLAANPDDLNAMIRAGELTLKLDDTAAAAGFFTRAERIDPNNPRIKAGRGTLLVRAGRPGEALRLFADAVSRGGDVRRVAADRGLAYDLIGEQERAQRDYRLALRDGQVDETLRRYALSLGISGKREEALQVIDPLLRRSDRAAWRARAFILAMNGDAGGAERIAASMMPGGLGQGLQPFFDRLPRLGPIDRAFAVHFGEVRATPQRLADARLTPPLPVLQPEPGRSVAAVAVAMAQPGRVEKNRRDRRRRGQDRIDVATAAAPVPLPQPPSYQSVAPVTVARAPQPSPTYVQPLPPVAMAANRQAGPLARETVPGLAPAARLPVRTVARPEPQPYRAPEPARGEPGTAIIVNAPGRVVLPPAAPAPAPAPAVAVSPAPATAAAAMPDVDPASAAVARAPEAPPPAPEAVPPAPEPASVATVAAARPTLPPAPGPTGGEDTILARIVANITVPGSELDVEPIAPRIVANITVPGSELDVEPIAPAPDAVAEARVAEPRPIAVARADPARARPIVEEAAVDDAAKLAIDRKAEARKIADQKLADQKAADQKAAQKKLDAKKPADAGRLADARKLADTRKAEELKRKNDPRLLEPARIWVQVAGGANEASLPRAWAGVREKAPVAFKGKSGWTTPLRATNRVLTGPFRSDAEARSFVNALSKEGVSAFTFTSDAGQKVAKLAGK